MSESQAKKRVYASEDLNFAADCWRRADRLITAGVEDADLYATREEAGLKVLKMVEPLLLSYFRFLSGQSDRRTKDILDFLFLFHQRTEDTDQAILIHHIRRALTPHFRGAKYDATDGEERIDPYSGCEVYSWFLEALFVDILPNYTVQYTDENIRINFFRYFQRKFCYSIGSRVKKELGWQGRRSSIDEMNEDTGYDPGYSLEDKIPLLKQACDLTEFEWDYLVTRARSKRTRNTRLQQLVEDQIRCRIAAKGLRTHLEDLCRA